MHSEKSISLLLFLATAMIPAVVNGGELQGARRAISLAAADTVAESPAPGSRTSHDGFAMLIAGGDIGGNVLHLVPNAMFVTSTDGAQIYDSVAGRFRQTAGRLHDSRETATATLLPNGKVLIAGGLRCSNGILGSHCTALDTAELYDPATGRFTLAGTGSGSKMTAARAGHSATLIHGCNCPADGKVLLVGGISGTVKTSFRGIVSSPPVDTAEFYDPAIDTFVAATAKMKERRENHCAALLADGRVLIAGGDDTGFFEHALATAEIYDPRTGSFAPTGRMEIVRELARATVLDPAIVKGALAGDVLVSGGLVAGARLAGDSSATAELFDPRAGRFIQVGSRMSSPRIRHSSVLLNSGPLAGQVLIAGGIQLRGDGTARGVRQTSQTTADIFDPSGGGSGDFRPTGELNEARGGHAFALLSGGPNSGEVLVAGGENCDGKSPSFCYVAGSSQDQSARNPGVAAELFDPTTGAWTPVRAAMPVPVSAASYEAVSP
jgi:hypothetical protein